MNATLYSETIREDCSRAVPLQLDILRNTTYEVFMISLMVVNAIIALLATVANFIVILAIAKTSSLWTPSNILVLGLATTDFITSTVTQPMYFLTRYLEVKDGDHICTIYALSASVSWLVSPMTFMLLTAITADRFLAVKLQLQYKQIVTKKSAVFVLVLIFTSSSVISVLRSFMNTWEKVATILIAILMAILLLLDVFFIASITTLVRRFTRQVHVQPTNQSNFNMLKYKRSVKTMYYMLNAFVLCYLPYLTLLVFLSANTISVKKIYYFRIAATTCVYMNGIVNPLIYFRRNRKLLQSAGEMFGCKGQQGP